MSEMAETLLKQGRGFLRAGDPARAAELLERAALLAREGEMLGQAVLRELGAAYEQLGQTEKAAQCRQRLGVDLDAVGDDLPIQPAADPGHRRRIALLVLTHLLVAGLAVLVTWQVARRHLSPAPAASPAVISIEVSPPPMSSSATPPAGSAVASALPSTQAAGAPAVPAVSQREKTLGATVARLVVLLRYAGKANGQDVHYEVPLSTATAFALAPGNVLLTTRSAVEPAEEKSAPPTLAAQGMPLVVLRDRVYAVYFASDPQTQRTATLAYLSDQHDLAVLKLETAVAQPLVMAAARVSASDRLWLCGYPALDATMTTSQRVQKIASGEDLADLLNLDQLHLVIQDRSAAGERNAEGTAYLQMDAHTAAPSEGAPVLNAQDEVVGIAVKRPDGTPAGNQYALPIRELREELSNVPSN